MGYSFLNILVCLSFEQKQYDCLCVEIEGLIDQSHYVRSVKSQLYERVQKVFFHRLI